MGILKHVRNVRFTFINQTALFCIFILLAACDDAADDGQLVLKAQHYIEQNQVREASLELRNALKLNSNNAEARYLLGQVNLRIGDMASAAKEFRKAQTAGWDEAQSQVGLMRALTGSHEFEKVIDGISIKDNYSADARANLYGLKAFSQAALGQIEAAKKSLALGKESDPDALQLLKTSIQLELTKGDKATAAALLQRAMSLYENNAELLLLGAYSALKNNDLTLAADQFQKVITLEPKNLVTFNGRSARLGLARLEIQDRRLDKAKELLDPLFKQSPNDAEVNFMGGMLSFEQGELDLAEERLLTVLKFVPEHAQTQLLFGAVNFAQKDYEQAAYYISKYLQIEPENINARKLLGRTYMLMGHHEQAQTALQPGMTSSDDAELLALIGLSQLQGGSISSGIIDLEKAVKAAPENKALRNELAKAYISAGETENAIEQINKILAEGGNRVQAEALMVSAYLRAEQYDRAINTALDLLERSPKDPSLLSLAGNVFAASGDRVEARKYFNRAVDEKEDYTLAITLLAALDEEDGNYEAAEKRYLSILKDNDTSADTLLALARLSNKQGNNNAMVEWLEKARANDLTDLRSRLVLAEQYLRNKKINEVELLVDELVELSPGDPRVLMLQGRILMQQKRYNEALVPLNKLVTKEANSIIGRVLLGESYFRLQQINDARRQLELALKIDEFNLSALLIITNVEQADGQFEKALFYSRKVQKVNPDLYIGYELEGDAQKSLKNYKKAAFAYRHANKLQPSSSLAIKLSTVLLKTGQEKEAEIALAKWLQDHAEDAYVRQNLASAYMQSGKNELAIKEFESVLSVQSDNVVALNNLAWLYNMSGNPDALKLAEKAYLLASEDPGVQDTYGWILVNNDQVDKGKRILERAVKSLPDEAEIQYHYAVALAKSGEKIEAKKRLNEILQNHRSFNGIEQARALMRSL